MLFEREFMHLQLLDVVYWQEETAENRTKARSFHALSIRMESDARFVTDSQTVQMKSGDLAFVPAGCGYTRSCKVDKMLVIHFLMDPPPPDILIRVIRDHNYDAIYPLFRKALTEWTEKKPGYYYRAVSLLYRIFGELYRQSEPEDPLMQPLVVRAVSIMRQDFKHSDLTIHQIAKRLYVSEAYLRRLFQQELRQSPKEFLTNLRLQRARDLLNAGYDPITVISEKVGFSNSKHFSTIYKKHFGYPPSSQAYPLEHL